MPTRKPRSARSLPTCCNPSASCDVVHVDVACAPPVPDACPDCGSWTIKDLRAQLTARGWRCGVRGKDYCPEHARELASRPNVSTLVG